MNYPHSFKAFGPAVCRIADVLEHSDRLGFRGISGLSEDAGVTRSSIARMMKGEINPTFLLVARVTEALEQEFGFRIDPRDLVAESGRFVTRFTCDLVGCKGCLPLAAREGGLLNPAFEGVAAGRWVTSKFPRGCYQKGGQ